MDDDATLANQLSEVHDAFVTALINSGMMGKIRAQLRAAALAIVKDDKKTEAVIGGHAMKNLPTETKIAFLLVDEFLKAKRLKQSHGIYHEECGVEALESSKQTILEPLSSTVPSSSSGGTLLEDIIAAALCGDDSSLQAQQSPPQVQANARAPSPDLEQPQQNVTTASAQPSASSSLSRGGSITNIQLQNAADNYYEDSIEYSDHSANSSLDLVSCVALERLEGTTVPMTAPQSGRSKGDSSDDDF